MAFQKVWRGIDLSNHNGDIDFKKVKEAKVDFAILRTGFGKKRFDQYDTKFNDYYKQCKANGIPVGAYHFSYALTPEDAVKEAEFMLEIVKGKQFEYPLYFDFETTKQAVLSKDICAKIIDAFCGTLERAGYWAGIYSCDSFFFAPIPKATQKRYACWVARVPSNKGSKVEVTPTYSKYFDVWQFTWIGEVNGISGDVDMNYCYKDYPALIKNKKLNGFGESPAKYMVTARIAELNEEQAKQKAEECKKLGMSAIIAEQ